MPYMIRRGKIPVETKLFLVFCLVCGIGWAGAFFINIPPFQNKTILTQGLEASVTLAMAAMVFMSVAALLAGGIERIHFTLKFLNLSGGLVILWSLIQAYFAFFHQNQFPAFVYGIQSLISSNEELFFASRVSGFAFEPSWLAHQLNLVFLPLWLSATLTGYSAHFRRFLGITVENLLLVGGIFILFASFSRVGIAAFFLVLAFLAIMANLWIVQRLQQRLITRFDMRPSWQALTKALLFFGILFIFFAIITTFMFGLFYIGAQYEPRLGMMLDNGLEGDSLYDLARSLYFAERAVFWIAGWDIFNDFPILGVGLGNSGFFMPEKLPAYGTGLMEISHLLNYASAPPNIKSMWVRILAETGIVGFAVFIPWYYLLWITGRLAKKSSSHMIKTVGMMGQFVWIAFLVEGFSVDSFALPYLWFSFGLLAAAGYLTRLSVDV
jgi:hypothetical protein